jgi:hypothetical protein
VLLKLRSGGGSGSDTGEGAQTPLISAKQWRYPGGDLAIRPAAVYDQLETYRQLAMLVCKFGLDRQHRVVAVGDHEIEQ